MHCPRLLMTTSLALIVVGLPTLVVGDDFADPAGDTFGVEIVQHDIQSLHTTVSATNLHLDVTFNGNILAPSALDPLSLYGYIDLDTDRSIGTGITAADAGFAAGHGGQAVAPGLGIEFYIDLFSEQFQPGFVDLIDTATLLPVGTVPISFAPISFSVDIPLALLGSSEANYSLLVGNLDEITDSLTALVPEPSTTTLGVVGSAAWVIASLRRRKRSSLRGTASGRLA